MQECSILRADSTGGTKGSGEDGQEEAIADHGSKHPGGTTCRSEESTAISVAVRAGTADFTVNLITLEYMAFG
jgi:hypothetical protein